MLKRLNALLAKLEKTELDAILITDLYNVYYLTGFWGSAGMVFVSQGRQLLVTDDRYALIAKQTVRDFDIISTRTALTDLAQLIVEDGLSRIGFEDTVSFAFYQGLKEAFSGYDLQGQSNFVEELRMIKDDKEIATIKRACQISDQAFLDVLDVIKPGMSELEVATFLDFRMRELGASGVSFDTIAASGYRSAMPHGRASDKVIEVGDALTLDFGCYYNHYASDMTRTIYIGHISEQEELIYQTVLKANQAVIDATKAGLPNYQFDKVARDIIDAAGYGPQFTHGIGHGLGLDVHEIPFFRKTDESPLHAGMVITDEPGIYLDGQFGVRIEDDLLVTETGCEVLTLAPKELIIL